MSLQIPEDGYVGPSKRPVSSAVSQPSSAQRNATTGSHRKQRASHQVVSGGSDDRPTNANNYTDVYSHPAAVAYAAQHPRRAIPKFGPYLLLQTLGEGEFGKVKLGLHSQWGEEVAVKLIRRGNVDSQVRMSKVEREIEVLRSLKHPNIVRLYDVIETDKYIGIILEYASGGELFDHILAHRYLKERDAARLFSQLISGVWYIHRKKIVHRDLKLENLLLDRHRNVIITDFGFANRFEHRTDDLMQTSCGSPCYAAPELVISEGLYVGSAVDIWSCGVILYAMLAGYLPFDDDPANPDGDNINLLYKYIVNTPLSFPDYVSESARDMLNLMLVPDPKRRASLDQVMTHPWLSAFQTPKGPHYGEPTAFGKTVDELERGAVDQHKSKRDAYQRQMRTVANERAMSRSASSSGAAAVPTNGAISMSSRSRSHQPEPLYQTSSPSAPLPSTGPMVLDDPFAGPKDRRPVDTSVEGEHRGASRQKTEAPNPELPVMSSPSQVSSPSKKDHHKKAGSSAHEKMRHTIQVEYNEPSRPRKDKHREKEPSSMDYPVLPDTPASSKRKGSHSSQTKPLPSPPPPSGPAAPPPSSSTPAIRSPTTPPSSYSRRNPADGASSHTGPDQTHTSPPHSAQSPPEPPITFASAPGVSNDTDSSSTHGSGHHRTGSSHKARVGSIGGPIKNIFGLGNNSSHTSGDDSMLAPRNGVNGSTTASSASIGSNGTAREKEKEKKKGGSRRNTLNLVVGTIKKGTQKMAGTPTPVSQTFDEKTPKAPPPSAPAGPSTSTNDVSAGVQDAEMGVVGEGAGLQASSSKAKKVMQWFRTGRSSMAVGGPTASSSEIFGERERKKSQTAPLPPAPPSILTNAADSGHYPNILTTPASPPPTAMSMKKSPSVRSPSDAGNYTPSFVARFRQSVTVGGTASSSKGTPGGPNKAIRVHHGAVDQTMITVRSPPDVMKHVREVLDEMGVEISVEGEYKYRVVRTKRKKSSPMSSNPNGSDGNVAAFVVSGTAGSNGVDRRGLPLPAQPSSSFSSSNMLKGLLMRRQSSQVSSPSPSNAISNPNASTISADDSFESPVLDARGEDPSASPSRGVKRIPIYGDTSQDAGDEVRFSVELTRLDRLNDTYSLDIRRLKGNLRSYKFLYDSLRERAHLE